MEDADGKVGEEVGVGCPEETGQEFTKRKNTDEGAGVESHVVLGHAERADHVESIGEDAGPGDGLRGTDEACNTISWGGGYWGWD